MPQGTSGDLCEAARKPVTGRSTEGGSDPPWPRAGGEIFYRNGNKILAVAVGTGQGPVVGGRRAAFEGDFTAYDIFPDAQRLVVIQPAAREPQLVVVLNWIEQLRRKLEGAR